ncbi:OmpA family protein [Seohaeicola zhoushanensis]|uniref:Membrane protein n=1 Tax=Seohaeicola zhoushanensis TaxID=1569283 RepID=A0A8J3M7V2_9RHOB|nr:OmpA family protein [Seohaeicola zhoushanensis]GHF37485.1 membrane protein [Seohaeicola zhoushanensis]
MRIPALVVVAATFLLAGAVSLFAAGFLSTAVENTSEYAVRQALDAAEHDWAEVEADGLQVIITGTAPDEARRFDALSTVGRVVDAARIINATEVAPSRAIAPPRFSVEILRNHAGLSIAGLLPKSTDRAALVAALSRAAGGAPVSDLMQSADYAEPQGWSDALGFAVTALTRLPRSKVSVDAGRVSVTAVAETADARRKLEAELRKAAPPGLRITLKISAPRPVITPFTLRFLIDDSGSHFDSCSADTEDSRNRILAAATAAGMTRAGSCTLGLGVPSPRWAEAVALAIHAVAELGRGSVTFADADITLAAIEGTDPALFDKVVGELENALPEVFALHAILPPPPGKGDAGPPEFTVTRSPEGSVQLRGRVGDETLRRMADAYAKARFGSQSVYTAARLAEGMPADWPVRVLTALEALSHLAYGSAVVTPDDVTVRGTSNREEASAEIAGLLSEKLGEGQTFTLDIVYQEPPAVEEDSAPTPEMCETALADIQATSGKISFEPGSATIAADSLDTMEAIAELLSTCGDLKLEIQGHTDSQGRDEMNQKLSQDRAQSVLNELRARRILTSSYTAVGYGETQPIADNKTEEGREANRRIEFRLIRPKVEKEAPTTLETVAQDAPVGDAEDAEPPAEDAPAPEGSNEGSGD